MIPHWLSGSPGPSLLFKCHIQCQVYQNFFSINHPLMLMSAPFLMQAHHEIFVVLLSVHFFIKSHIPFLFGTKHCHHNLSECLALYGCTL